MASSSVIEKIRSLPPRIKNHLLRRFRELPVLELNPRLKDRVHILPPILDEICLPPYHGPTDHDDYWPLMALASLIQPRVVVELGTAYGNTVANICRHCPHAAIYTVNALAEEQSGTVVTFSLTNEEIGRVYRSLGYQDQVVQVLKNTLDLDLSEYFDGPVVDLGIVDACHDTDYVINDFLKLQPFVKPGGLVLFHDTHPSMKNHLRSSYVACMTLRRNGYKIYHIKNTWWAVWVKAKSARRRIRELCELT